MNDPVKKIEENVQNFESIVKEMVKNQNYDPKVWKSIIEKIPEYSSRLEGCLECAWKDASGGEKEELRRLYDKISSKNISAKMDRLREIGQELSSKSETKYKGIVKALKSQAYRIMEKTRHGESDEVYYMILRIFVANEVEFPQELHEVFKPNYPKDIFKTFIYSFLGAIFEEKIET